MQFDGDFILIFKLSGTTLNTLRFPVLNPSPWRLSKRAERLLKDRSAEVCWVRSLKFTTEETSSFFVPTSFEAERNWIKFCSSVCLSGYLPFTKTFLTRPMDFQTPWQIFTKFRIHVKDLYNWFGFGLDQTQTIAVKTAFPLNNKVLTFVLQIEPFDRFLSNLWICEPKSDLCLAEFWAWLNSYVINS